MEEHQIQALVKRLSEGNGDFTEAQIRQEVEAAIASQLEQQHMTQAAIAAEELLAKHGMPVMGKPNKKQLQQINQFRPNGSEPFTEDDIISVPFIGSDNLVHSDVRGAWTIDTLKGMAKDFPGNPLMLDHAWALDFLPEMRRDDPDLGFVCNARLVRRDRPPERLMRFGDKRAINKTIVEESGYQFILFEAAIRSDHPVLEKLKYRQSSGVSTGTFGQKLLCPHCKTEFGYGRKDSDCPHTPPTNFLLWWLGNSDDVQFADYFLIDGFERSIELSLVKVPALVGASIVVSNDRRIAA